MDFYLGAELVELADIFFSTLNEKILLEIEGLVLHLWKQLIFIDLINIFVIWTVLGKIFIFVGKD